MKMVSHPGYFHGWSLKQGDLTYSPTLIHSYLSLLIDLSYEIRCVWGKNILA